MTALSDSRIYITFYYFHSTVTDTIRMEARNAQYHAGPDCWCKGTALGLWRVRICSQAGNLFINRFINIHQSSSMTSYKTSAKIPSYLQRAESHFTEVETETGREEDSVPNESIHFGFLCFLLKHAPGFWEILIVARRKPEMELRRPNFTFLSLLFLVSERWQK